MHAGKRFYASVLTSDRRLEKEMFGAAEMTGTVDRQRPGLAGDFDYLDARHLQRQPRRSRDSYCKRDRTADGRSRPSALGNIDHVIFLMNLLTPLWVI